MNELGRARNISSLLAVFVVAVVAMLAMVFPALSLATTITEFSSGISSGSGPGGITAGPDGNVWFTEETKHQVGRITPAGVVTEFSSGITGGTLGITTGPDANIWFTEFVANKIAKITASGVVTEFALPGSSAPAGITRGPDGNVWFTASGTSMIGRITPGGAITEFPTPTAAADPQGIALGPDGNLWFTERNLDRIGRITPSGAVTEFRIGLGSNGIAAAPDGNVWYTTYGAQDGIGRLTPSGTATEFTSGVNSSPSAIAAGPDGNLWFTEYSVDKLGRATIDHPIAVTGAASGVAETTAALAGSVDPQGASVPTSYHFDYGTTAAYGKSTQSQTLNGTTASGVAVALSGLTPGTGYHYRLVASNAVGSGVGSDQLLTTPAALAPNSPPVMLAPNPPLTPHITGVSQSQAFWREGNRLASFAKKPKHALGTSFSFTLNEPARVRFAFSHRAAGRKVKGRCVAPNKKNRDKHKCQQTVTAGTLSFAAHAGLNRVAFQGRLAASRKLGLGRYTLVIVASASGRSSAAARISFSIAKT